MLNDFFEDEGQPLKQKGKYLVGSGIKFNIKNGIPRFTPDTSYSTGNFSKLRERHASLQLDSMNGTNDRLTTILNRTGWKPADFKNKTLLECGCGAGPDTETLLNLGANVIAVDIAGVDVAKQNLAKHPRSNHVQFVQDSITNLHLRPNSFDIVFCHRVLQHTPNPEQTLEHILKFVKPNGKVFVHSYSDSRFQTWRWKYWLLPLTNKLPPEYLYKAIKIYAWPAFYLTNLLNSFKLGRQISHMFIPFLNYRSAKKFARKSNKFIVEYGVHDTFDALSPKYDKPIKPARMDQIASRQLKRKYEVFTDSGMTLLRTK